MDLVVGKDAGPLIIDKDPVGGHAQIQRDIEFLFQGAKLETEIDESLLAEKQGFAAVKQDQEALELIAKDMRTKFGQER
jgi:hypothetical protein